MKAHSTMGTWKSKKIKNKAKASRTSSGLAKRIAYLPPEGGWVGGHDAIRINATGRKVPA